MTSSSSSSSAAMDAEPMASGPLIVPLDPMPMAEAAEGRPTPTRRGHHRRVVIFLTTLLVLAIFGWAAVSTQHPLSAYRGGSIASPSSRHHADRPAHRATNSVDPYYSHPTTTTAPQQPPSTNNQTTTTTTITSKTGLQKHAAEVLQCKESVINFVINATDGKDECEGLKKAFDKACSSSSNNKPPTRQRRRLSDKLEKRRQQAWHGWVWRAARTWHRLLDAVWSGAWWTAVDPNQPSSVFVNDALNDQCWQDSVYVVEHDLDHVVYESTRQSLVGQTQQQRSLQVLTVEDEEAFATATTIEEGSNATATVAEEEKAPEAPRTPMSLTLPTTGDQVSDSVFNDALVLQQGEDIIEQATTGSTTNNATKDNVDKQETAASAKAVSDTTAAISALLHDPTSVQARTCCTSILKVYNENCSADEEEEISDRRLFFIVFVIAVCGMVKSLIRHFRILWLPEAAGCIVVGVLSGYLLMLFPHHDISFDGNWFLRIMVPPIVFEAALSIDKRAFNRHIVPILLYAVIGTLMATIITAFVVHRGSFWLQQWCYPIPYVEALTFGALISSIDPIAVLSVLSNMGMTDTDTIYVVIFGESLLNDGVAIVLFQTLVHFLDETLVIDSEAITAGTIHFFVVAIGSLLVGIAAGMMSTIYYWAFNGCQTPLVEILMFVCWALLPYYVCDGIGWSGIVSAVATGFVMDLYIVGQRDKHGEKDDDANGLDGSDPPLAKHRAPESPKEHGRRRLFSPAGHLSKEAKVHIGFVTEMIATLLETAIFAYLGLFLFSHRYHWNMFHSLIAIAACLISRAIMIPVLSFLANWILRAHQRRSVSCSANGFGPTPSPTGLGNSVVVDRRMQVVLWFAGLRGAMSFALVEHIPLYDSVSGEGTRLKAELKAMTSATILFTVFILGGLTYYVMELMGMSPSARHSSPPSTEMTSLMDTSSSSKNGRVSPVSFELDKNGKTTGTLRRAGRTTLEST